MLHGILSIIFLLQGIPVQQGGRVTGVLRDSEGTPLAGIRMAAVARGATLEEMAAGISMAGLTQTDEQGRFTLEEIPPGRYSIAAGRLDLQTYYPGTQSLANATILTIAAGETITGINFILTNSSSGRTLPSPFGGYMSTISTTIPPSVLVPIDVRVEDGSAVPVFGPAGFVAVGFEPISGGPAIDFRLDTWLVRVPGPGPVGYRVKVRNLPEGTAVKSITYDGVELQSGVLQISAASFGPPTVGISIFPSGTAPSPTPTILTLSAANPPAGANTLQQGPPLVITLARSEVAAATRIRGMLFGSTQRSIYISGAPGILYSDGTFEFRNVGPGRHSIVSADGGSPLAASFVIGNSDVEGVRLETVAVLPEGISKPAAATPADGHPPGTRIPLASIRGKVLDRDSREPPARGMAYLRGEASESSFSLNSIDGSFDFRHLLPGKYTLEITTSEHQAVTRNLLIGDDGIDMEIEAVRTTPP